MHLELFLSKISKSKMLSLFSLPFLLLALFLPFPYAYYTLLRFLVTANSLWLLQKISVSEAHGFILLAIAVLYNPLIPVHLNKPIWNVINFLTILYFVYIGYKK
ncbi:MAG: hypothetical protein EBR67_03950 [Proteobacteria bacterium]|nr:hypothetical protein [Pseudomonadota bacterium]